MKKNALIVGAGSGLSAALARLLVREGYQVMLACRDIKSIAGLCHEIGASAFACDASSPSNVEALFKQCNQQGSALDLLIYNAGYYERGPITELKASAVKNSLMVNAYGAFLVAQAAAQGMLDAGSGTMLFTGASAGLKGYPESAPFAMGKFALRGLCQSLARELAPKNIHVAHCVIDGLIYSKERGEAYQNPLKTLDPDAIANTYYQVVLQDRSAWTWELELRPFTEPF